PYTTLFRSPPKPPELRLSPLKEPPFLSLSPPPLLRLPPLSPPLERPLLRLSSPDTSTRTARPLYSVPWNPSNTLFTSASCTSKKVNTPFISIFPTDFPDIFAASQIRPSISPRENSSTEPRLMNKRVYPFEAALLLRSPRSPRSLSLSRASTFKSGAF